MLDRLLSADPLPGETARPPRLLEAMRYVALGGGSVNVDVGVGSGTLIPVRNWKLLRIFIKSLWATCAVSPARISSRS